MSVLVYGHELGDLEDEDLVDGVIAIAKIATTGGSGIAVKWNNGLGLVDTIGMLRWALAIAEHEALSPEE